MTFIFFSDIISNFKVYGLFLQLSSEYDILKPMDYLYACIKEVSMGYIRFIEEVL